MHYEFMHSHFLKVGALDTMLTLWYYESWNIKSKTNHFLHDPKCNDNPLLFQRSPLKLSNVVIYFTAYTYDQKHKQRDYIFSQKVKSSSKGQRSDEDPPWNTDMAVGLLLDWNRPGRGNESLVERELQLPLGSSHNQYYPKKKTLSVEQHNQIAMQPC